MPTEERFPVWANKTALSLGAVATLIVIIIPCTIWFATISAKEDILSKQLESVQIRLDALNNQSFEAGNRLTKLETLYPQIQTQLADIKSSLDKIEARIVK